MTDERGSQGRARQVDEVCRQLAVREAEVAQVTREWHEMRRQLDDAQRDLEHERLLMRAHEQALAAGRAELKWLQLALEEAKTERNVQVREAQRAQQELATLKEGLEALRLVARVDRERSAVTVDLAGVALTEAQRQRDALKQQLDDVLERLDGLKRSSRVHLLAQPGFPEIICLCGSTRFGAQFAAENLRLTLEGKIVLSIGCNTHSDYELWAEGEERVTVKARLDELHLRKLELCDRAFVINVGGYVGPSTRAEIAHAKALGRPVEYLEAFEEDER